MKLKLEIEFDNEEQMARVTEAIAASSRVQAVAPQVELHETPAVFNDEDVTEEPSSTDLDNGTTVESTNDNSIADDKSVSAPVQKRKRRTKVEPVAKTGSVLDNAGEVLTDEERKAHAKELAAMQAKPTVEEALTQTPKNFYSLSDFLNNFAVILNNLVKDGTLTHRSLTEYCSQYGVPFIYALAKDKKKLEDFYNLLIKQGHITKKGDY